MESHSSIDILRSSLEELFESKLSDIIEQLEKNDESYQVNIPEKDIVDLPIDEILSIVARSSNNYVRLSNFSGIAKAQYKLAKARFDRTYKQNYIGSNSGERDKNAMTAAKNEHDILSTWESVYDLIQGLEQGAKVASESSRKILGHMTEMEKGQMRESAGKFSTKDFEYNRP